ncbi:hypothetical protein [Sphingomonas sp. BK580]|uniref:hypothetical protein n=1 Tax=Sphingomonas sp. BK580 TaxID=2586972 RepID=UPI00160E54EA|nr:hypothetical protein [Sphingomonas sp. BK580]MBB3695161.1 1,2-phenylacetyl-CoA epoxidase PaaB subunit [Sphingomonas sp. BK580]
MLHHDHLANFARQALLEALTTADKRPAHSRVWQLHAAEIRRLGLIRFDPRYVCEACNNCDGRGKDRHYKGRSTPIYPASFSMTPDELHAVRIAADWDEVAPAIWEAAREDHCRRREAISRWAADLAASV